ncbi:hypothetical protein C2E23DRAFT_785618 [Lenzites betulinus]|nr:hypothetical protein C2E23DRAFT_785618 [Lenzites betulinus]
MQQPGFDTTDVAHFDCSREVAKLDNYREDVQGSPLSADDRWIKGSVRLRLPKEGVRYESEEAAPEVVVDEVYFRPLVDVFSAALQQECVRDWTFIPYKLFWLNDTTEEPSDEDSDPSSSSSASQTADQEHQWCRAFQHSSTSSSSTSSSSSQDGTDSEGIRVYSEVWEADAWLEEDAAMRARPCEAGDPPGLERAIIAGKLYSDSTHVSSFGHAYLWPIYGYILNQSKYVRGRPTAFAAHHLAYVPSLPDTIQDAYIKIYGIAATAAVLTFLKRELMQQIWLLLMDDHFMYAYVHGILLLCGDKVLRRLFIRFFIYAADYPEKILLACLRYFAKCPCPRCRINKDKIIEMGTRNDLYRRNQSRQDNDDVLYRILMTRRWIFEDGVPLTSAYIARVLDPLSITPTRSAFSIRLREHGLNFYSLFVPDLMHEFELGVWKSVWIHLLRILFAAGDDKIQELNKRFRQVPSFGRSTVRRFSANVSGQSKLAARDFEARLKCFMPTFEGLLPLRGDNRIVLDMVFNLAMWHALAKLREHTDISITGLEDKTVDCGMSVREFAKKTCTNYVTVELPSKDSAARGRRKAAMTDKSKGPQPRTLTTRKLKVFNYTTYKFHAMPDYAPTIRMFASVDNYSTQVGELEHRHVKRFYVRTNRNRFAYQIAQHMRRSEKLRIIKLRVDAMRAHRSAASASIAYEASTVEVLKVFTSGPSSPGPALDPTSRADATAPEKLPYTTDPLSRYHISDSQRKHDDITALVSSNPTDPAMKDFVVKLKDHLLARLDDRDPGPDIGNYTARDRNRLLIRNNRAYWHQVLRVNYTSYDRQRAQDLINPTSHPDILLRAPKTKAAQHPYWYARVLKVLHVNARTFTSGADSDDFERIYVLWVRWFRLDTTFAGGIKAKRLHRLQFVPADGHEDAFDFINPADVLRGTHLIPAFAHGLTKDLLAPSIARLAMNDLEADADYKFHYVNLFADRDMFMRYYGNGVGHKALHFASQHAVDDEDLDTEWQDMDEDGPDARPTAASASSTTPQPGSRSDNVRCADDVLNLVPQLARARQSGTVIAIGDEGDHEDDEDEERAENEELEASADGPDEGDEEEDVAPDEDENAVPDEGSDEEGAREDEYDVEGFAPL